MVKENITNGSDQFATLNGQPVLIVSAEAKGAWVSFKDAEERFATWQELGYTDLGTANSSFFKTPTIGKACRVHCSGSGNYEVYVNHEAKAYYDVYCD